MLKPSSPTEPRFTYADYQEWTGDERWELVDGEALAMSPAPSTLHQAVVGELFAQVHAFLRGRPCKVFLAPFDVRLPRGDEADGEIDTVVQPDLAVICDLEGLDAAGYRGAPDWIVEVLSPQTAVRDQVTKRGLYERAGVREYWILDPTVRLVTLYRQGPHAHAAGFTGETRPARGVDSPAVLPGLVIDWSVVFAV